MPNLQYKIFVTTTFADAQEPFITLFWACGSVEADCGYLKSDCQLRQELLYGFYCLKSQKFFSEDIFRK